MAPPHSGIESFMKKSPQFTKHKWTIAEKETLCLIQCLYNVNATEISLLWNKVFEDTLRKERFGSGGLPTNRLTAQLHELRHGGTDSRVWERISGMPLSEMRTSYRELREKIEDAAQTLRLVLKLKIHANSKPVPAVVRPVAAVTDWSDSDGEREDIEHQSTEESLAELPESPCRRLLHNSRYFNTPVQRIPPMLRTNIDINGVKTRQKPRLLFRAFDPGHGYRARRFLSQPLDDLNGNELRPPQYNSDNFRIQVEPHLMRDPTYQSPFISLAENPRRALELLMRLEERRSFAIFDYLHVEHDAQRRYDTSGAGDNSVGPYLVPNICDTHGLHNLPGKYRGAGEFLVYGTIECAATAVFTHEEATELYRTMKKLVRVGYHAGIRLALYLKQVDDRYKEIVAYKLIRAFKVRGFEKNAKGEDYEEFVEALYSATRGHREMSIFSAVDIEDLVADDDDWSPVSSTKSTWSLSNSHDCDEERCPCYVELPETHPKPVDEVGAFSKQLKACVRDEQAKVTTLKTANLPATNGAKTHNGMTIITNRNVVVDWPVTPRSQVMKYASEGWEVIDLTDSSDDIEMSG